MVWMLTVSYRSTNTDGKLLGSRNGFWNVLIVAYFNVLSQNLYRETQERKQAGNLDEIRTKY
jgi:hypothetical protein